MLERGFALLHESVKLSRVEHVSRLNVSAGRKQILIIIIIERMIFFLDKPESLAETGNGERGKVEEAVRRKRRSKLSTMNQKHTCETFHSRELNTGIKISSRKWQIGD